MIVIEHILFGCSLIVIFLLSWYIKVCMKRITEVAKDFGRLKLSVDEYAVYLDHLYSLETFYGEPIIQDMVDKTKALSKRLKSTDNLFSAIEGNNNYGEEESEEVDGQ
jgi:hypothetical protein